MTVRFGRAELSGTANIKVRLGRAELSGTAAIVPKVRYGRLDLAGTAAVLVVPLQPQTVEPESTVNLAAGLVGGGSADSWAWRPISGPSIGILGSGATVSFKAPSAMPPGTSVVVGVRATVSGTQSPEQTVTITILPQLQWYWTGTVFAGSPSLVMS